MASVRQVYRRMGDNYPQTLQLFEEALPPLRDGDVLIKIHAVSLNYRDVNILRGGNPWAVKKDGIPVSDASGEVVGAGPKVTRFNLGDRVMPIFDQKNILGNESGREWLGGDVDGVMATHCIFPEAGIVEIPHHLTWEEAACLPCAGLTAWNGLNGLRGLGEDHTVVAQGTGGVSMMALKLAASSGANLILTSSSDVKLERVKGLCGLHAIKTINYETTPRWEEEILKLTHSAGVDITIENGGGQSLLQSLKATKRRGQVSCIGYLGGTKVDNPNEFLPLLIDRSVTMRGINVGSRAELEELCALVEARSLEFGDVIARKFDFHHAQEAFEYLGTGNCVGKVIIAVH